MITSTVSHFAYDFPAPVEPRAPRVSRRSVARATSSALQPFEGIWVPIITPFRDGCLDFGALQRLASDLANNGIQGLVACGTTGEASQLDDREQAAVLSAVLEAVGPGYPVVMGVSDSDTRVAARKVRDFSKRDIAGFLISAPCDVRPSQDGILQHFRACAGATDRPIVLYNEPARSGVNLDLSTAIALSADPQFVAMKESSGNIAQLEEVIHQTPLKVLSGDDTLILGGYGVISAAAHIRPDLYVHLYKLMRAGQLEQARAVFKRMLPLIRLLYSEPSPAPIKAVLALQGRVREELRLPLSVVSRTCRAKLAVALGQVRAIPPVWPVTSSREFPELRAFYESEQFSESGER